MASRIVFGGLLVALFTIDLKHHRLPNALTWPGSAAGLAFSVVTEPGWRDSLLGVLVGGGALFAFSEAYYRLRHEDGLGMGDVKMLAMIGAFIGWKLTILAFLIASCAASVVGLALLVTRRAGLKDALPFGCFLAAGAAVAATTGPSLLEWYFRRW